jgi:putative multiple sugar transport system ATP-binding protein
VLRDGATVASLDCRAGKISEDTVIRHMVGREMADRYPKRTPDIGGKVFEVKNWKVHHEVHPERVVIKGVDLHVNRGEIVGIAGLMGAGRTELAMSIFGETYGRDISGEVFLHGKKVDTSTVQKAINNRIAYVTEDRKGYGLVLEETIAWNTTLANLQAVSTNSVIDEGREFKVAEDYRRKLNIRSPDVFARTVNLSGGNQQKVVLAKWLFSDPEVLILDEPTRGIDVGAKYEIYTIIAQLAAEGKCVLMISSEMPELLGMCDRICVLNEGKFVAEFTAAEASQEKIMRSIVTSGVN